MSRIHEALKKAAQERTAQLANEAPAEVCELPLEIQPLPMPKPGAASPDVEQKDSGSKNQIVPLSYEELLKRCVHSEWALDGDASFFRNSIGGNGGAEKFRTLRSRLYQIADTRTLKRLLVTSSVAGEGKTFVTLNLAQSFIQQADRRVLLIDADLRVPRLHEALGAPRRPGLGDYLRGEAGEYAVIQKGPQENLFLIPCGTEVSNPSELLSGERMKHLLELMTPVFDWIIVDSPPALPVYDSSILANLTDGVLLVVAAGATDAEIAEKVAEEFREKNLLGVVLNRVDKADSYGSYYYSGYGAESSTKK